MKYRSLFLQLTENADPYRLFQRITSGIAEKRRRYPMYDALHILERDHVDEQISSQPHTKGVPGKRLAKKRRKR